MAALCRTILSTLLIGSLAGPVLAAPESGWWWNAAEGGRGFTIEVQNGMMFMAGYMYDELGRPSWYASGPTPMVNDTTYRGTWLQYGGGQTLTGAYKSPALVNANVGSISVNFSSATAGTLVLPNGRSIALSRYGFGGGDANGTNATCTTANITLAKYNAIALGLTMGQVKQIMACNYNVDIIRVGDVYTTYSWSATGGSPARLYLISITFDADGAIVIPSTTDETGPHFKSLSIPG